MKKNRLLRVASIIVPLLLLSFWSFAQPTMVKGTVLDESGDPMPGVTIFVKGTTQGTTSGPNGTYTLNDVNPDAVLIFSFIGMKTEEIAVNGQSEILVTLTEEASSLEEVVVVGYGTQLKEAVTGSVSSIGGDDLRDVPSANITTALQGRLPGVEMSQTSSKPGATMQIRIRGTRSLNASNDPLIVLDGIPFAGSIADINTNDIKSINILKDASATAIYGSRGANGVILITTNKGSIGQKAQLSYNSYYGMRKVFAQYPMMDGPEFVKMRAAAGMFTNSLDESDNTNTNWQDLIYRTGVVTSHDLGVAGGTEQGSYNYGIGYYNDVAVLPGQDYTRFSMRASLDQNIGKYIRLGFTSNNNYAITNGDSLNIYNVLSSSPIADPYNSDGTWKRTVVLPSDEMWVYSRETIDGLGDSWKNQSKSYGSYNNIYGEVKIPGIEGLKYRLNVGLNLRMLNEGNYVGQGVFNSVASNPSSATISNSLNTSWVIENLLTYDRIFAEKHRLNLVALYSAEQTTYNKSYVDAKDIPSDHFQYYNLGQAAGEITVDPRNQDYWQSGLISYMGRAMYSYDNRYMMTATVRADGSSRLAEGHKWHTYPALSLGWNIKRESFMDNVDWLNLFKLRAGYGQTSNQAIAPYATLGRLTTRPYNFGEEYSVGTYVTELPNENLGWEYSITWNYGLDFALFNNRLSGTVEYYTQHTKDLLLKLNLPSTSGVSSYYANIGETQNNGIELSLQGILVDNLNGWSWDAGINLYSNHNELTALSSGQDRDEANWWFVGYPINVIFDYENLGLWQETDTLINKYESNGVPGMIKVRYSGEYDEEGVPVRRINADDRQILSVDPKFQGGFNTRIAYKGLDLSVVGAFKSGGILISTLYSANGYLNMLSGRRGNVAVDYWTPENTDAKYPAPDSPKTGDNPKYGSTMGYFDASYLKIRTISLGYNFDQTNWMRSSGFAKLRIYATVQNPFVFFSPFHTETGLDPETNSFGDENAAVTSAYKKRLLTLGVSTPSTRNYLVGINLTF